jgi:hypothetical protein
LYAIYRTGMTSHAHFEDPYLRGLALGFLMGFIGLLTHALGSNTFIIVRIMEPFWLVAGLLVKSLLLDQQKGVAIDEHNSQPVSSARTKWPIGPTAPRAQSFPTSTL